MNWHRRVTPSWRWLLPALFLHAMGVGLMMPALPVLIRTVLDTSLATAAVYGGWLTASYAALQFVAAPLIGSFSDRRGRRPVLILSSAMFCISYLLIATAGQLSWLLVAQALAGGFAAATSAGAAYIADLTKGDARAPRFGQMGAVYGLGLALGPLLSGWLLGMDLRLPAWVAATLALLNVIYLWQCLPESLTHLSTASTDSMSLLAALRALRRYPGVMVLLGATLLFHVSIQTLPTVWPYYTMQTLGWTPQQVGYSLTAFGLLGLGTQGVLTGVCTTRLGIKPTLMLGLSVHLLAFAGIAAAHSTAAAALCILPAAVGMMTGPALTAALSHRLPAHLQGTLQGVIASAISLAAILTPLCMPVLFRSMIQAYGSVMAGAPYMVASMLSLLCLLMVARTAA